MTDEQHLEIIRQLTRIEESVKGIPELEKRVSKLENQRAWLLGASAVVGAAAKHFLPAVLALVFTHGVVNASHAVVLPEKVQWSSQPY